jgi:hypothetical protein
MAIDGAAIAVVDINEAKMKAVADEVDTADRNGTHSKPT